MWRYDFTILFSKDLPLSGPDFQASKHHNFTLCSRRSWGLAVTSRVRVATLSLVCQSQFLSDQQCAEIKGCYELGQWQPRLSCPLLPAPGAWGWHSSAAGGGAQHRCSLEATCHWWHPQHLTPFGSCRGAGMGQEEFRQHMKISFSGWDELCCW